MLSWSNAHLHLRRLLHPSVGPHNLLYSHHYGMCTHSWASVLIFHECSTAANAFQGELLGLVVIQLLLHSMDLSHPNLTGSVKVYSDCKGARTTISSLPCARVSSSWTRRYFENHCSALSLLPIQTVAESHEGSSR